MVYYRQPPVSLDTSGEVVMKALMQGVGMSVLLVVFEVYIGFCLFSLIAQGFRKRDPRDFLPEEYAEEVEKTFGAPVPMYKG
jgi:hypothetical protein